MNIAYSVSRHGTWLRLVLSAYSKIPVARESFELRAFTVPSRGLFQFKEYLSVYIQPQLPGKDNSSSVRCWLEGK